MIWQQNRGGEALAHMPVECVPTLVDRTPRCVCERERERVCERERARESEREREREACLASWARQDPTTAGRG